MNKTVWQYAFVYVSVIVGAGYTSGQEILQFFTGYGMAGIAGTVLAGLMFIVLGALIGRISARLGVASHKELLSHVLGRNVGGAVDLILTFFLFGVGVIMVAGTGSVLQQRYGFEAWQGATLMAVLVALTLCLNMRRIVDLISAVTPLLVLSIVILAVYSLQTMDASYEQLAVIAAQQETVSEYWWMSSLLYASFAICMGVPMLAAVAGRDRNVKNMVKGGMLGGLALGVLILVMNLSLFGNMNHIQGAEIPTIQMLAGISPWISTLFVMTLVCMIYSSAVSMFFSCCVRFAEPNTKQFRQLSVFVTFAGLGCSFIGFTKLVGTVYPLLGYVGFVIILGLLYYGVTHAGDRSKQSVQLYANQLYKKTY